MEDLSAVFTADGDFFDGGGGEDIETILDVACAASYSGSPDVLRREIAGIAAAEEEEELEWLSNRDAFPPLESCFGILSDNPNLIPNQTSPVSVLRSAKPPPSKPRTLRSRKRRTTFTTPVVKEASSSAAAASEVGMRKRCWHCESDKTPQWREGPMGPKTLCNACGVRYKSGRLLPEYRPANSPTFCSLLHSNSHRKVVQMRKRKNVC